MRRRVLTWTCVLVMAGWLLVGWRLGDLRFGMLGITAYASQAVEQPLAPPAGDVTMRISASASDAR
ncbi:MAG: hypothetical protein GVY24_02900 [Planctomycetes bacterium]|jgi:hypothetical protein|nr:hypothetical protein [Planctomycetota bacterium]